MKWANDPKAGTRLNGSFEERDECPIERPGERTDLAILYEYIKDGLSNYEIMERNPDYMLNLEKIERARQAVREQQYRETFRQLETTYIWGPTGTGKTRSVMEGHSYAGVYRVTDYTHPFDSYAGEEVLLLDEYNSNFKIRDLLNFLDGYPLLLPARYSNRAACYRRFISYRTCACQDNIPRYNMNPQRPMRRCCGESKRCGGTQFPASMRSTAPPNTWRIRFYSDSRSRARTKPTQEDSGEHALEATAGG